MTMIALRLDVHCGGNADAGVGQPSPFAFLHRRILRPHGRHLILFTWADISHTITQKANDKH
jgi:hypothetical protein